MKLEFQNLYKLRNFQIFKLKLKDEKLNKKEVPP